MFDKNRISLFKQFFQQDEKWVIIPHLNPDGDAIGASMAFGLLLADMGISYTVIVPDSAPEFLSFLPGMEQVLVGKKQQDLADKLISEAGVVLLLDHNDFRRSGNLSDAVVKHQGQKIMIDHHPDPVIKEEEALILSRVTASSTCELSYEIICQLGYKDKITSDIATVLMAGMITDTGAFSYNCSNNNFFINVAGLIDKGADKDLIIDKIYNQYSEDRMRLVGYLINQKMEVFPDIKTAIISLNWSEMHKYNFKKGDSEGVVNMPLSIKGIELSVFISVRDDKTKLSFRSKGEFPANKIAAKWFSGGGHLNAAGGSTDLSVEDTVKYFKSLFPEIKKLIESTVL
ncbi:bifunctional oligoribonuclease/PAP phosphatase NrnA [Saccharicrinis sp. FJH54]|uniref:DHH family phosphoesterase n=1 Tax=Saccharicrinis sp. FJH54 TaxID=3344665 RepID=UPI0035D4B0DF